MTKLSLYGNANTFTHPVRTNKTRDKLVHNKYDMTIQNVTKSQLTRDKTICNPSKKNISTIKQNTVVEVSRRPLVLSGFTMLNVNKILAHNTHK